MKALTWHGKRDVRVEDVPDPTIEAPTDAIVRITSSGICGSDLHLYEVLGPFMSAGDVLGHEPMGIVEEVGGGVTHVRPGDRVLLPFNICCGHCFMCGQGLHSQCETTQVREEGMGCALFGFSKLYGSVPGGQAESSVSPRRSSSLSRSPKDRPTIGSSTCPTCSPRLAGRCLRRHPQGRQRRRARLGPIGDMATRIARHQGAETVIGVDLVPERLERARANGVVALDLNGHDDLTATIQDLTDGRGPDAVIDAVGMEAHGAPVTKLAHDLTSLLPSRLAEKFMKTAGLDRLAALNAAIDIVPRGGTISIIGVYGGMADPLPLLTLFDKQIQVRMGQANVKRWVDGILPLLTGDGDPLGVDTLATTVSRWRRDRPPTRCSRRRPTAPSRSSCGPDGARRASFDRREGTSARGCRS